MARQVISPLRSETDYDQALDEIERYFENEPKPGTPEAERFDYLARAIKAYEDGHWPIETREVAAQQVQASASGRVVSAQVVARSRRSAAMSGKRDYHVVPSKSGGWDVKREGADRSSGHFDRKSEAMDRGRDLARSNRTELVEHGQDGRIRDSDSYGNDPAPPRDKNH